MRAGGPDDAGSAGGGAAAGKTAGEGGVEGGGGRGSWRGWLFVVLGRGGEGQHADEPAQAADSCSGCGTQAPRARTRRARWMARHAVEETASAWA